MYEENKSAITKLATQLKSKFTEKNGTEPTWFIPSFSATDTQQRYSFVVYSTHSVSPMYCYCRVVLIGQYSLRIWLESAVTTRQIKHKPFAKSLKEHAIKILSRYYIMLIYIYIFFYFNSWKDEVWRCNEPFPEEISMATSENNSRWRWNCTSGF